MTALTRLRTAIQSHGLHEIDSTWQEAISEYRANAREIRESWLLQQISICVKRLNVLRSMQIFERENDWHPAVFRREIARNNRMLKEHRAELAKLRSEQ